LRDLLAATGVGQLGEDRLARGRSDPWCRSLRCAHADHTIRAAAFPPV